MKKMILTSGALANLLAAMVLLLCVNPALAALFEDSYDWNSSGTFQGRTYQEIGNNSSMFNYEWSQTINFAPAAAEVNWATLTLSYIKNSHTPTGEYWFLSDNNNLKIGNLVHSENQWEDQDFDISFLFTSSPVNSFTLALKLTENTTGMDKIYLDKCLIYGDYTPVPIPPTVLLMGTGLAGLIAIRRRRAD
ncbi:putative PEP motif anchor domain protein [uncultured Desulfobacterium sp.]|uniref:Putative PEP motif anchor domain protein n=1 Tax=uncultured Desulfobacterium sp. TaxID=201089 RepID=A0A445MZN6_9BACT|nr:putative PEP motif anchor domain protein [uncultured Desulfobacterium sp.]